MANELGTSRGADYGQGFTAGITVTAAPFSVIALIIIPRGATRLYFQVENSHASVAFDSFAVQRRVHASGALETLASVAGDYTTPQLPLLEVQGAPVTLAKDASVHIRMDVEATDAVRIYASGLGAASAADIYYRIQ